MGEKIHQSVLEGLKNPPPHLIGTGFGSDLKIGTAALEGQASVSSERQQAKGADFPWSSLAGPFGSGAHPIGPGRKDDQGKLRMDMIPAAAVVLILEHCKAPILGTPSERYTQTLAAFMRHMATNRVEDLAIATQGMLGMADVESRVLVPAKALEGVARVLEFGANRAGKDGTGYGWNNWQNVASERYLGGFGRHLAAIGRGETHDLGQGGSGELHALNGACCGLFRLWQVRPAGGGL